MVRAATALDDQGMPFPGTHPERAESGRHRSRVLWSRVSLVRALLSALVVSVLTLTPLKIEVSVASSQIAPTPVIDFTFTQAHAADRRGGRSGDRSGRGGGKSADRRGLDRDDTPGTGDSASSSGRSGSSSSAGSSASGASSESPAADAASADASGTDEAGGRDAGEAEAGGGDRSPRSWFSIDASDMDTLNVGVIASRMGKAPSDPMPDLCFALTCHDVR